MNNIIAIILAAWSCSVSVAAGPARAESPAHAEKCFKVVVHRGNPTVELELSKVARMFLKKVKLWPDGNRIVPVDQQLASPVRKQFSRTVSGKSVTAIESFWQRMIFSGRDVPPAVLATDRKVLDFVRREPAAIGYVSCAHASAPGVTMFDVVDQGGRPILVAGKRGGKLRLGDGSSEDWLSAAVPSAINLAYTASSRGGVRILLGNDCGTGGRRVFVHNRHEHGAAVTVEHRIVDDGRLRFRRVRIHQLPAAGRRHLGCSKDGSVEHAFTLGDEP